jgi:pimeloyl-ACP methyl ester carboxylesterase
MRRGYLDLSTGQVHYRTHGDGKPVLLLHQTPSSSLEYEPLMSHLGQHYRTVAMDTPGYGLSDPPPGLLSIADYAAVAHEFITALEITSVCVLGHHTGATLALEMAVAYPDTVSALVLSSLPFYEPGVRASRLSDPRFNPMEITADGAYLMDAWNKYRQDAGNATPEDWHVQMINNLLAGKRDKDAYQAVFRYDEQARLRELRVPTLHTVGTEDLFFTRREALLALIPDARSVVIEGGDGLTTVDRAPELAASVVAFLGEIGY